MKRIILLLTLFVLPGCTDRDPAAPEADQAPEPALARTEAAHGAAFDATYEVGFTTFVMHDETRGNRPIAVYVWYPVDPGDLGAASPEAMYPLEPFVAGDALAPSSAFEAYGMGRAYEEPPAAAGPFPLILYSAGWTTSAYDGLYVGTGLAKHGFVVAATTHWGDRATWFGAAPRNPAEPYDHIALALLNRPRDVSAALDLLLERNADASDLLFGSMDPGRVVASGWSLGGYAAMVLAGGDDEVCDLANVFPGGPVPPETCVPSYPDPRISMIIPLDGSNQCLHFYELARIHVPAMGIGQEWGTIGAWQARQHAAFSGRPSYRVDVFNSRHVSFSNRCVTFDVWKDVGFFPADLMEFYKSRRCPPGMIEGDEAHRIILKYMLAFLTHDQRILTPGHTLTHEPSVEFFVTEKRSPQSIQEDWPGLYVYHIHQPGKAHAMAFKDLVAMAEKDPLGPRPMDFALLREPQGF